MKNYQNCLDGMCETTTCSNFVCTKPCVIKVDKAERRIGLSIKAANYSEEMLRKEAETLDTLRPGEDMVGLDQAFQFAEDEYRPGQGKK